MVEPKYCDKCCQRIEDIVLSDMERKFLDDDGYCKKCHTALMINHEYTSMHDKKTLFFLS